jgi:uncharacterized membrane protein YphA (DoxX/SURF4 family)
MIEHIGSNPAANVNPWSTLFKSVAILRIGTGVLLMSRHGAEAAWGAYEFLWKEQNWGWVRLFNDAGIPYPTLTAPAIALLVAGVALSWCLGFLTRLFALLFLPVISLFIVLAQKQESPLVETGWLYLLVAFTLLLFGSGSISIDKIFHWGGNWTAPKKRNSW